MMNDVDEDGDSVLLTQEDRDAILEEISDISESIKRGAGGKSARELARQRQHLENELAQGRRLSIIDDDAE